MKHFVFSFKPAADGGAAHGPTTTFFLYDECHRILAFRLFPAVPDLVTLICGCPNDSAFTTE